VKEVEVRAWCDWAHQGREPAVIEVRVAINGSKFKVLDLCADHDMLLAAVFERGGTIPDSAPVPLEPGTLPRDGTTCPECGMVCASRSALGQHLKRMHERAIRDYRKV